MKVKSNTYILSHSRPSWLPQQLLFSSPWSQRPVKRKIVLSILSKQDKRHIWGLPGWCHSRDQQTLTSSSCWDQLCNGTRNERTFPLTLFSIFETFRAMSTKISISNLNSLDLEWTFWSFSVLKLIVFKCQCLAQSKFQIGLV